MSKLLSGVTDFIQLFAEGGDGGTGGGAATGQIESAPAQPNETAGNEDSLAHVRYGKQEDAPVAGEQSTDRSAEFRQLIKGDYKEAFEQEIKGIMGRRLKGTEDIVAKYNKLAENFDLLAARYGLDANAPDFVDKLVGEQANDEGFYEDAALEQGLTVAQLKEQRRILRENAQLKAQIQERENQKAGEAVLAKWQKEAEELKAVYQDFDLARELQNEQFRTLLGSNIPIRTAFEVVHRDEILPAAMQYSAKQAEKKVSASVLANKNRPQEGALGGQSAATYKSDVSQLTDADMREINARVMRGERITF